MAMAEKGVPRDADVVPVPVAADFVGRVPADVHEEQIEKSVAIVVEEDGARRMAHVVEPGRRGDVAEPAAASVLEQEVSATNGGDVEIGIAIVVDVGKGRRDADSIGGPDAGPLRPVLEPSAAQVPPEPVGAHLGGEVQVGQAVTVDVGDRQSVAMVVVHGLVRPAGVADDSMLERDAAVGDPIDESKIVVHVEAADGLQLRCSQIVEPARVRQFRRRHDDLTRGLSRKDTTKQHTNEQATAPGRAPSPPSRSCAC